tara:strand:- start:1888 stop:2052 length:165 start_codon:yes stop_codon:yes gene_type:complete
MSDVQLALFFPYLPVVVLLIIYFASGADIDDDDDDDFQGGKGILQPIYAPAPTS